MRAPQRPPHALLVVENVSLARDHRLRKQATALRDAGIRVSVICRQEDGNDCLPGVTVHEYPSPPEGAHLLAFVREFAQSWVLAAWLTVRVFVREGFDVLQISGAPDIYFPIALPFRVVGRPFVFDQRDLAPEQFRARFGHRLHGVHRLLVWLERLSYRTADRVLTVNDSLLRVAVHRGGVAADKVTIVGNGPVLAHVGQRPPRPELRHGRRHLVCWVGAIGPQDNVGDVLQAAALLVHRDGRDDFHLVVVGSGDGLPACQALAEQLGLQDHVSFTGWVSEDEMYDHIATAAVGLDPNLEEFVSPVKAMEYMALGLPFVAYDLDEPRRLGQEAGVYAPAGDVERFAELLGELLDDPAQRRWRGEVGRRLVRTRIAWDHQRVAYVAAIQQLIHRRMAAKRGRP
jgi:glycosyltransferase involved in cell wall biosynthesis